MEELLCEPGPDRLGFSSLIGIGDRFQRAMLRDPCQVSLDGEPGAVWIDIAPCLLLALSPETPALGGPHQASMTDAVDVPEVPGSAALHQRDHLARHQPCGSEGGQCLLRVLGEVRRADRLWHYGSRIPLRVGVRAAGIVSAAPPYTARLAASPPSCRSSPPRRTNLE